MKGNENKSGKSRTAIVILTAAVVILVCILLAMHGCNGGNDESEGTESGVSSENESSDVLNGVHSGDSDDTFSCGAADGEPSTEPSESSAVSESDISDNSAEISAESDKPDESDYTVSDDSHVNSRPDEESEPVKPVDNPKPLDPPVTKVYNTEWGTRPHEFEELKNIVNQAYGGKTWPSYSLVQHSDGYGNTWFTSNGKVIGNGAIFDLGFLSLTQYANYFGYGYWGNGFYYWSENLSYTRTYDGSITANVPLKDHGEANLPDDMPYGAYLQLWWQFFIENECGIQDAIINFSDLNSFMNWVNERNKLSIEETGMEWAASGCGSIEMYLALNIHNYEELIQAMIDPFSYPFSPYTHKF